MATENSASKTQPSYGAQIDIIVEGGVIQDVIGVPEHMSVRVIDYDTDGTDPSYLSRSPYDDNDCVISEWGADDLKTPFK